MNSKRDYSLLLANHERKKKKTGRKLRPISLGTTEPNQIMPKLPEKNNFSKLNRTKRERKNVEH